jgi:transposase InsO family protein
MLIAYGITCSMSRRGDCYDNAVIESFFSSLKSETADRFASCGEAKRELFDYIEVFYNQRRRHSTLGQISPAVFEQRALQKAMEHSSSVSLKVEPTTNSDQHCVTVH